MMNIFRMSITRESQRSGETNFERFHVGGFTRQDSSTQPLWCIVWKREAEREVSEAPGSPVHDIERRA